MTGPWQKRAAGLTLAALVAGCSATTGLEHVAGPNSGFQTVAAQTTDILRKDAVWVQNSAQAEAMGRKVHALVHKRTIGPDTAVQVALLNNRGLQAAYAEIGVSAAELWQETLLPNPRVSLGVFGIAHPELGAYRSIEGMVAANILALATRGRRVEIAEARFRQAQLRAVLETLSLAGQARQAWIDAVAAFETVYYLNQAQVAADAASELARKLGESGAMPKAGQAREHAFYAELTGQRAKARLAARLAKEKLTRVLGLWGAEVDYFVPNQLPGLPRRAEPGTSIEALALNRRIDLRIARLELDVLAKAYGLTDATRLVTDLELIGGFEAERELEDGVRETITTPQLELEFVIPIFDSGRARLRKAEMAYMRAANLLAERAVNVRSEARAALTAYRASLEIARHYQSSVLPLRKVIEEEALLTYNGMITNTFELLADTRAKINTILESVSAKRDFWLAELNLMAAVEGGGGSSGIQASNTASVGETSGGGH